MSEREIPTDEERAEGNFEIGFACFLCGEVISEDASDFCEISVTAPAGYATFTAHARCLRDAAHEPAIFPDLETAAEQAEDEGFEPNEKMVAYEELLDVLAEIADAEMDLGTMRAVIEELRQVVAVRNLKTD